MNGRKKRGLFKRRKKQAEEAMQELISLNEVLNLFGDKSQVADEIDPSIKKGLYNPFQQLDRRTGEPLDSLFQGLPEGAGLTGDRSGDNIHTNYGTGIVKEGSDEHKALLEKQRWKLTPDVIDPITGQPGDLYGAPTQSSDWWKKEQGYVKDPDTGEWYEPDFPLGSAGGQPTFNPEFHKEMQEEMKRAGENSGTNQIQKEGNRLREYLKKLIQGSKKSKDEYAYDAVPTSQRDRPGVQYV